MADLGGKTLLISGGSRGIGEAIAVKAAADGANVALLAKTAEPHPKLAGTLYTAAEAIEKAGGQALPIVGDVRDEESVAGAVAQTVEKFGGIDIVVNNAGIGAQGTVAANDDAEWHRVYDVNVVGVVRVSRACLPHLRRSEHAAIVNTGSIVAWSGLPNRALYSATKGAVYALTLAMAADHVGERIRVNCVHPGTADTPWVGRLLDAAADPDAERAALEARQPMGRLVSADEVAHAIVYLASPAAASTTGTALAVDGGVYGLRLPAKRP